MNDSCPRGLDAALVPWDTITVELTINFSVNANNSAYITSTFPTVDDSYSTQLSNSGSITHTYTFSREAWNGANPSTNNFQVGTGYTNVGDGVNVPPFFRDRLAHLLQNGYVDTSVAWNIAWAYNYTRVGPTVGTIPTNASGTFNANAGLSIDLSLTSLLPTWTASVFSDNGIGGANDDIGSTASEFGGGSVIIPFPVWLGLTDDGDTLKPVTLKTVAADAVNFGVTLTQNDSSAVASYWAGLNYVATTATQNVSFAITTS